MTRWLAGGTAAVLFAAGCSNPQASQIDSSALAALEMEISVPEAATADASDRMQFYSFVETGGAPAGQDQSQVEPPAAPMLIRVGTARIEVDSLDAAMARLRELAAEHGGYIGDASMATGSAGRRTSTLQIKVPEARFDGLVAAIEPLGRAQSVSIETEDVSEEFVDVQARLANARRLERRLLAILDRPGADLEDILAVEREIARVREQAERLEGRVRYLQSRASLATLTVTLFERGAIIGNRPIQAAFRNAWRNFVGVIAFLIEGIGGLLPVLVLVGAGVWLAVRLQRRYRARASS